jgi:hypothetical protein
LFGLCPANPNNPKCKTPIMQSTYTAIFGKMGKDLGVNPLFVMSTALQESGWNLVHVYGTNSSSNGQPLNNLFGATYAGGNNIAYPNVEASAQAWEQNWGGLPGEQPPDDSSVCSGSHKQSASYVQQQPSLSRPVGRPL